MNSYDIGDTIRLSAEFVAASPAVSTDPTTVTLKVEDPTGTESTFTYAGGHLTKSSTGNYHYDYVPTKAGRHTYRFIGTGALQTAEETPFYVRRSRF